MSFLLCFCRSRQRRLSYQMYCQMSTIFLNLFYFFIFPFMRMPRSASIMRDSGLNKYDHSKYRAVCVQKRSISFTVFTAAVKKHAISSMTVNRLITPKSSVVWYLDVASSHPVAAAGPKDWAVRPLKRYIRWESRPLSVLFYHFPKVFKISVVCQTASDPLWKVYRHSNQPERQFPSSIQNLIHTFLPLQNHFHNRHDTSFGNPYRSTSHGSPNLLPCAYIPVYFQEYPFLPNCIKNWSKRWMQIQILLIPQSTLAHPWLYTISFETNRWNYTFIIQHRGISFSWRSVPYTVSSSSIRSCSPEGESKSRQRLSHGNKQVFSISAYIRKCHYTALDHLCEYLSVSAPFCLTNHISCM